MSSFYGQMRWQDFQRFFYNFTLNNNNFSNANMFNASPLVGEETVAAGVPRYIQPHEDFATFKINAANHWIKLAPIDSYGDEPRKTYGGFSIFHDAPSETNLTALKIFDITSLPANTEATILKSGDSFKVLEIKFDKAGHFSESVSLEPKYFQMQPQIINVNNSKDLYLNDDQKFHFVNSDGYIDLTVSNDNKSLTFNHKTSLGDDTEVNTFGFEVIKDEGAGYDVVRRLKDGDYISTQQLVYDSAGHLVEITKLYYQLPTSEVAENVSDLTDAVKEIQEAIDKAKEVIQDHDSLLTDHNARIEDIEEFLGDQNEMHEALISLKPANEGQVYNVGNGFKIMTEYMKNTVEGIYMEGFLARVKVIEEFLKKKYPTEFK